MNEAGRAQGRPLLGIGRRLGGVFLLLAGLLATIGIIVTLRVSEMHTSVEQVFEEQRESTYSRDIAHALHALQSHVQVQELSQAPTEPHELDLMRELTEEARVALLELEKGPDTEDPSEASHSREEARLYDALGRSLGELTYALASESEMDRLSSITSDACRLADALRDAMRLEAQQSSMELLARGRSLRSEVAWMTLAALCILGLVTFMVQHWIVRPVEHLRDGAARIASGELGHRVDVASKDEIGVLANEFNRMAGELQDMRADLEARVEERTREFLRAARLAGLGTMAAGIAHEINNPLASIASCAEGLERKLRNGGTTPEQQREYLQIIAKEAYRAHEITSRLLDFARSQPGQSIEFRLDKVLRETRLLLEHELQMRELRLTVRFDQDVPPIHGDPSECKQVVLNLLRNAIDASPAGSEIRVSCRRDGGEVVLEIEDEGPGIPSDDLERIFDPFFTTKAPGKGTGLGLAIVHSIVEAHGGRVEVIDTGHGATFRVHMPLR